ncbi:MAG: hypothetical protein WC679_03130 [Bacteroidales bacterium]|jgi:hypothetical protein
MKYTINYRAIKIKSIIKFLFISLLFSFSINQTNAQTVEELDTKLNILCCDEGNIPELEIKYRDIARELLRIDTANKKASIFLYRSFNQRGEKDSINLLVKQLVDYFYKKYDRKDYSKFYLLDTNYCRWNKQEIRYNEKYYLKDSTDVETITSLAENYYKLFNETIKRKFRNDTIDNYAKMAIFYTEKLCKLKPEYLEAFKYPLIQLRYFLGEKDSSLLLGMYKTENYPYYFPILSFAEYPKDWLRNYDADLFSATENFLFINKWYEKQLKALEENRLYLIKTDKEIFRFTWLRTFNNPVAIRIEKEGDNYFIIKTLTTGKGGYEPGNLKDYVKKRITKQEWDNFISLQNKIKEWGNYYKSEMRIIMDGAEWIYEYKTPDSYKIIKETSPDKESKFAAIGLYLIKLCGLENETIY